jgi:hypothetical protein
MVRVVKSLLIAVSFAVVVFGLSAFCAAEERQAAGQGKPAAQNQDVQERWRYTFHNSEWWYWLPSSRWVFWRNCQWNDYDPRTYTLPGSLMNAAGSYANGASYGRSATGDEVNRPYYGHAISDWDWRTTRPNDEIGPFYDHAMPSEVYGTGPARFANRPYYGHAVSYY